MSKSTFAKSPDSPYLASVIISVYKDIENLAAILHALENQSFKHTFEVIVSEDGQDPAMKNFIADYPSASFSLAHLTQDDQGFRKNRALNRAVASAKSQYLLFLDGDCVPHIHWLKSHLQYLHKGRFCIGRRVELGPRFSQRLKKDNTWIKKLSSPFYYLAYSLPAILDGTHHYEAGIRYHWLQRLIQNRETSLLGCNFSCCKDDLIAINGFNELYQSPGYGEDSDIEFRLRNIQVKGVNLKFFAQVFHLYHKKQYTVTDQNKSLYMQTVENSLIKCSPGIDQYL